MHRIIVFAIPVFALFMGAEFIYGLVSGRNTYRLADSLASLSQGLLSQAVAVCTQLFQIGLYAAIEPHIALFGSSPLWQSNWSLLPAVVLYDFCDYWLHRVAHENAFFWAAHVVHHQSQHMNLSTALRQESGYPIVGWMFYLPLALVGVPPETFGIAGLVVLLYQFWIHTEHVGRLGWFDRVFSSPSNHRVHHAVNDGYIDRNYGAILIVWDRLFGTFQEEREPCVYGTRTPLESWDPLWALAQVYAQLLQKMRSTRRWRDKARVLWKGPGWTPPGVAPEPAFDLRSVRPYEPPVGRAAGSAAVLVFVAMVGACCWFLWQADEIGDGARWLALAASAAGLWAVGALAQGRLKWLPGSLLGAVSTAIVFAACAS